MLLTICPFLGAGEVLKSYYTAPDELLHRKFRFTSCQYHLTACRKEAGGQQGNRAGSSHAPLQFRAVNGSHELLHLSRTRRGFYLWRKQHAQHGV